ncbi:MAG: tetratricopeptide repeat protein, partial [Nitrolancea sp.]
VLELLSALVEQSLVAAETDADGTIRYRMLEPIRQFASHRAEQTGEAVELSARHFEWALAFAQSAGSKLRGADQHEWLDRLEIEHDNLRAALSWSQQAEATSSDELQLAASLWRFWETRGHISEGRRWLDDALSRSGYAPTGLRAQGLNAAGNLARDQGDNTRATELHQASLAIRRELGDEYGQAQSLTNLGNLMLDHGNYERATQLYSEAMSFFREHGEDWDIANALNNLGIAFGYLGDYEQATVALEEALRLREAIGETASRARSLDALGVVMHMRGDSVRARYLHEASLALRRELGDKRGIAIALNNLGVVARSSGDLNRARQLSDESLQLRREIGDRFGIAMSLASLADVARDSGDLPEAIQLYKEAMTLHRQIEINEGIVDSLLGISVVLAARGEHQRAAHFMAASDRLREEMNLRLPPANRSEYEAVVARIQDALGDVAYAEARERGSTLSIDQAVDEALMVSD